MAKKGVGGGMEGGTSLPLFPAFLTVPIWDTPYTPKTTFLPLFGVILDPPTHFTHFGVILGLMGVTHIRKPSRSPCSHVITHHM